MGTVGRALMTRARRWQLGPRTTPKSSIWPHCPPLAPYLAVQAQEDEHHEEQGGPQWGQRHHGDSLGVGNKGQAWAWRGRREKGVGWSSDLHSIVILIHCILSAYSVPGALILIQIT